MSDAILKQLADVIDSRKGGDAAASYVARLFALGEDAILKKIGEEATEAVLAAKGGDTERIVSETADLWFHCMVMLSHYGLRPENVLDELSKHAGTSGIEEQALRKALARGL
ncbi:MAG TPA: phosphoribosyl-ATP diphosphatase [Burkholderiaceae bacterium]|nr:phosphoribosyl-ATP diphosphatase [Burkholderiaceae bacterium]